MKFKKSFQKNQKIFGGTHRPADTMMTSSSHILDIHSFKEEIVIVFKNFQRELDKLKEKVQNLENILFEKNVSSTGSHTPHSDSGGQFNQGLSGFTVGN